MTAAHRFGSFEVQPDQRRLLVNGRVVAVGSRAFDVLLALAERAGQLVSKNQLLDLAWPGLVVEENNLQVQISTLRKVLGPHAIATIPGRGYRLTAAREHGSPDAPASASPPAAQAPTADAVELASLFGRDEDIGALQSSIRQHPLVTVVGPAGIGKTRLAHAVALASRTEFPDGVRFVELASLADASLVTATVARSLGLASGEAGAAIDVAAQALAGQRLLVVLDNCEHVLEEVDAVVAALRKRAPSVRILATSQELLRHPDEQVYRLGPLEVPPEATRLSAAEAGSVQLLVARVRAAQPRFELTDDNVAAVVEICRRLDGIPLAIELAAARVPLLGVEGVRQRLDARFRLLTAGSRLALPRHQTLRAALEWSYALLSPAEQRIFQQLGVFAGSFSLEAAQRLATSDDVDEWTVLDHLGALVDKSLVIVEGESSPRYRMLETTRAFALECLARHGDTAAMMRRHAQVMRDTFERYYRDILAGTPPTRANEPLVPDLDNLRAALHWASQPEGDHGIAVALYGAAGAAQGYLHHVALNAEASQWSEVLLPLASAATSQQDAARFWLACADGSSFVSPVRSIDAATRAIDLYRDLGDALGMYLGWSALAYALLSAGRLAEARSAIEEALSLRDPGWPAWLRGTIANTAALVSITAGAFDEARAHGLEYLALSRQIGSLADEWTALGILVEIGVAAKNVAQAMTATEEMLARYRASPELVNDGLNLRTMATALLLADRLDAAEHMYGEALGPVRRSYGTGALVLGDAALLLARRGRIDDAARVLAYADCVYAARGIAPRLIARQMRETLHPLLAARRDAQTLARLYEEGRQLTDDDACALAFPQSVTRAGPSR